MLLRRYYDEAARLEAERVRLEEHQNALLLEARRAEAASLARAAEAELQKGVAVTTEPVASSEPSVDEPKFEPVKNEESSGDEPKVVRRGAPKK